MAFYQLMEAEEEAGGLPEALALRLVIFGGEALKVQNLKRWFDRHGDERTRLVNMYGITETTVHVTYHPLRAADARESTGSPIGRRLNDLQVYVLDEHLQPVPIGVAGELHVAGPGLARGYLNRADLTSSQFIPDPFSEEGGERLYKTGDQARYLADGNIEYLGRLDEQVKIRGFRVEVGEVETLLKQHEKIKQAVVAAWEADAGGKRLVAYVVSGQSEPPARAELRAFLKQRLPDYMVPAAFIFLTELPLTASGKVNRRALPEPGRPELSDSYVGPRTETEALVCALWAQILKLERVGIYDNFFELGGHSLLATQLMSQVRKAFGVEIPLRLLFEQPTVAGLTRSIEAEMSGGRNAATPIQRLSVAGPVPLSFSQQRLWFLEQLTPGSVAYNMPIAMRLSGALHFLALQQTFSEILRRHEVLRTSFPVIDGEPVQLVSEPRDFDLPVVDLSHLERRESEQQGQRLASEEAQRPFDFTQAPPLLRATLLRLSAEEHILLLTMHHIISDGWSLGLMVKEVATLYQAFRRELPSPLPELEIQYADYALWQRRQLSGALLDEQLSYWREQLQSAPALLELPTDQPRPAIKRYRGARETFHISEELAAELKAQSRAQGVTMFMLLLAAFKVLMWRYSGQEDIVVGTPIANRQESQIEDLVGFFVNTLALRTRLEPTERFADLVKRVREECLAAYQHQAVPFELVVEELAVERSLSYTPIFQVMFVLQNELLVPREMEDIEIKAMEVEASTAKVDLLMAIAQEETGGGLRGVIEYDTDLFEQETVQRLA